MLIMRDSLIEPMEDNREEALEPKIVTISHKKRWISKQVQIPFLDYYVLVF